MRFDELDTKMRAFEAYDDTCVLPEIHMIARIDGRGFTRLTREIHTFETPFDERFRNYMIATTEHLMNCGFRVIYGYTQSDEISLLFHKDEESFGRKLRKFDSVLAGEASAKFSLQLNDIAAFDCRICQLPHLGLVRDYFRWRSEDALRNALNAHCYWVLRKDGQTASQATKALLKLSTAQKNELLFEHGINFNDLPSWQKRGVGLFFERYEKEGLNPKTGNKEVAIRRRIKHELELPMKEAYDSFIESLLNSEYGQIRSELLTGSN